MNLRVILHEDATHDESHFSLRSRLYGKHYGNIPIESFQDRFDHFDSQGRRNSRLLGVWYEDSLVGTCRLIDFILKEPPIHDSEIEEIFNVNWSELARLVTLPMIDTRVVELSKFAIAQTPEATQCLKLLLKSAGQQSLQMEAGLIIAVMTPQVERVASRMAGAGFQKTGFKIRRELSSTKRLLLKYHDYFLPGIRKNGLELEPTAVDIASDTALDMLLVGNDDGPALWWILPSQLSELSCTT